MFHKLRAILCMKSGRMLMIAESLAQRFVHVADGDKRVRIAFGDDLFQPGSLHVDTTHSSAPFLRPSYVPVASSRVQPRSNSV